jgi:hypothetical protein
MSGAVEGVALLPCPFCGKAPCIETEKACYAVMCVNAHCGESMSRWFMSEAEAVAAWNVRAPLTTPPARSYADAIEDAAKVAEDLTFGIDIGEWLVMTKKDVSARACHECAAAIRLLSQGGKA